MIDLILIAGTFMFYIPVCFSYLLGFISLGGAQKIKSTDQGILLFWRALFIQFLAKKKLVLSIQI